MLNKILSITIFTVLSVVVSATSFSPALDSSFETISSVRKAAIGTFFVDSLEEGLVIVSVRCPESFDYALETVPQDFNNVFGKLPRGVIGFLNKHKNQYFQDLLRSVNQGSQSTTEFIFTGYGHGGKIALVLSSLWAHEFNKTYGQKPKPNQIKSITFSATAFGDGEFNNSIKNLLGAPNILDFSSYYSTSIRCGAPIQILPDEQFLDSLKSGSYNGFIKTGIAFGFLFYSYSWLNDLIHKSDDFIRYADKLVSKNEVCSADATWISSGDYATRRDNFINARSKLKYLFSFSFLLLFPRIYDGYKNYRFIPSEKLVLEAFKYAQDNYHANEEASLDSIGSLPLISARRGVGKSLRWLIGI